MINKPDDLAEVGFSEAEIEAIILKNENEMFIQYITIIVLRSSWISFSRLFIFLETPNTHSHTLI